MPAEATVIDVSGKSVLPGLIDMHGHMYVATAKGIANAFESYPALYLAGGVTSVRSPGDFDPRSARRPNTATPSCATSRPRAMVTRLLPGTLYSTIKKLLNDGLLEEVDAPRSADSDDARRRYYRVTKQGRVAAEAETRRMAVLVRLGQVFRS